jgi:hypothetical protein
MAQSPLDRFTVVWKYSNADGRLGSGVTNCAQPLFRDCGIEFRVFAVDSSGRPLTGHEIIDELSLGVISDGEAIAVFKKWITDKAGWLWIFGRPPIPPFGGNSIYDFGELSENEFAVNLTSLVTKLDSMAHPYENGV